MRQRDGILLSRAWNDPPRLQIGKPMAETLLRVAGLGEPRLFDLHGADEDWRMLFGGAD